MSYPFTYKAFGLTINSEFECPELKASLGIPDVTICFGYAPKELENPIFSGVRFQSKENEFLLTVDRIARYFIENGSKITIQVDPNADINDIRLFLLGSAFGALIHQRGLLPFHGSSVKIKNSAIIFSGLSGSGKSTLAAAFNQKGYKVLSDDVSVISFLPDQTPIIQPGYPQMKLWKDTIQKLGHDPLTFKKVRSNIEKHSIPIDTGFWDEPLPLHKIIIISSSNLGTLSIEANKGLEKFNLLKIHTYRFNFIVGKQLRLNHFNAINALAKSVDVMSLTRPSGKFIFNELIDLVLKNI